MTPSISLTLSKKKRKSVVGQSQTHYIYITWIQREKNKPWELHVMVVVRADCSNWLRGYGGLSWPFFFHREAQILGQYLRQTPSIPLDKLMTGTYIQQVWIFLCVWYRAGFCTGSSVLWGVPLLGVQVFRVGGYWEGSKIKMYVWKLFYLLRLVQRKRPIQIEYSFWPVYCYINILYDILLC